MLKKIVLSALVLGVIVAAGCSSCNKCKAAAPCNTCDAPAPCSACDK